MNAATELVPAFLRRKLEAAFAAPETMRRLCAVPAAALHGVQPRTPGVLILGGSGADLLVAGLLAYWQHCGFDVLPCPWSWVSAKSTTPPPADSALPKLLGLRITNVDEVDIRKLHALTLRTTVIVGGWNVPFWTGCSHNCIDQSIDVRADLQLLDAAGWPARLWTAGDQPD